MTDKLAAEDARLRAMVEITLPCCDNQVQVDEAAATVRCDACAIELELAWDARTDRSATPVAAPLQLAA